MSIAKEMQTCSFHSLFTSSNNNTRKSMNYGLSNVAGVDEFTSTRAEISIESSQTKNMKRNNTDNFQAGTLQIYMRILICSHINCTFGDTR